MTPCVSSGHRVFWVSIPEKFKARLRVPITVKKCHDFYKGKYLVGAGWEWSIVSMARSVAAHGPTWCWRSWEFHIQTFKQQEENRWAWLITCPLLSNCPAQWLCSVCLRCEGSLLRENPRPQEVTRRKTNHALICCCCFWDESGGEEKSIFGI